MPGEWRHTFLKRQLWLYQVSGDWGAMLKIRDALMAPKGPDPKRSLLDADLLYQISGYFSHIVFFPPGGRGELDNDAVVSYWEKHYQNDAEAARILEYVVEQFDDRYFKTYHAAYSLAMFKMEQDKPQEALALFRRLEQIELGSLYAVPSLEYRLRLTTAEWRLEKGMRLARKMRSGLPERMVKATKKLPLGEAVKELKAIGAKYEGDEATQKRVAKELRRRMGVESDPKVAVPEL